MPKERMHEIACRGFTAVIDEERGTVALRFIDDTGALSEHSRMTTVLGGRHSICRQTISIYSCKSSNTNGSFS